MKKIVKSFILVAAAAMGFTACQKEMQENLPVNGDAVQVTFVAASADTKTSVDTSGEDKPVFSWGENETFAVLEQTDALAAATSVTYEKVDGKAKITATFDANAGKGQYQYATIYPASGYVSAKGLDEATLSLPATQTMAENSYDPAADLMVSEVVTATAQPTEAQMVGFTRVAAVVKMTLKNLAVDAGDKVQSVTFAADGKVFAGNIVADLTSPKDFVAGTVTSNSVTVSTNSSSDVYFTVLPAVLEAGTAYTVAVTTDKKLYVKQGQIPEGKTLEFQRGMVNRFGVDMGGVAASDKWMLVKDASTLEEGDVVTIAAKDYDKAISRKLYSNASETSTSARRDAVDVSKYQDYLIMNADVQPFVLVSGATEGTFAFYDEARGKFLVSNNKSSRYLISQSYVDLNTSFAFTIDAETGDATIKNVEGDYMGNMIRYYNSSKYFYSGTSANQAICVYQLAGAKGTIPVVAAAITVPDSDESVVIAEEGAVTATAISDVVFNYVGGWNISASAEAEWLDVAYDAVNNCLTYTAEPNTEAKRETTVTITASLEGQDNLTWDFKLIQKGAPQEISIAEFVKLVKDENATYKITGRITETTTSSSGTYKLTDGNANVATVTYLYTDGGVKVSGNSEISVAVGDVMTVTTVPVGSGKGGNSSHYSIYKGHYGLKATMGVAAGYAGGAVEIDVETYSNGNITLPESVIATMADNDFAELAYSDGKATVTFISENTASYAREAAVTFTYGQTSVTVTAQQGINPANKLGYELVTDASALAAGDEVIIVSFGSDKALGCLASSSSATGVSTIPAVDIEKSGTVIYDAEEAGVMLLTLKAGLNEGEYAFQFTHKGTDYYLNAPSSGLKGRAASSGANNSTSYAVTIDKATGVATLQSTYPRIIKFNSKTGTNFTAFKLDAEGATLEKNHIAIYKKQK